MSGRRRGAACCHRKKGPSCAPAAFNGFIEGDKVQDGTPLNRFRPDVPISRAEVARLIAPA